MVVPVVGCTETVMVIVVPRLACMGETVSVVVVFSGAAGLTVTVIGVELDGPKVEVPEYDAVTVSAPTGRVDVLQNAVPACTRAVQTCVVPS